MEATIHEGKIACTARGRIPSGNFALDKRT